MDGIHSGLNLFNLLGLLFEHSKVFSDTASLTTLGVVNFGGDWDRGFLRDLDSIVTKRVVFGSDKEPFSKNIP